MLFEDNDFDINMAFFIPDVDFSRNVNILSPMEGFLKGNMLVLLTKKQLLSGKNIYLTIKFLSNI